MPARSRQNASVPRDFIGYANKQAEMKRAPGALAPRRSFLSRSAHGSQWWPRAGPGHDQGTMTILPVTLRASMSLSACGACSSG